MESKYIEDIFKDYLATEKTNYAILINGSWGSGKTYFWKSTLTDLCKSAKFKPIYLSLNGINKIETLDYQLKIKLIPLLNKFDAKKTISVKNLLKNIGSAVIKSKWDIDAEKMLKDVEIDLTLFSNNVVCFDDLERCKIPLSEVLGYVNDYVEHKNLKVIFLSHEKENDPKYNEIKEKVIGRVLNFKNNLIDTLPFLFEKYKSVDLEFYNLLHSKKEYIYNLLVEYKEENLRNISFYIDNLSKIYPVAKSYIEYFDEVILFTLIITIEFKIGKLTSNDYQDFKGYENLNSAFVLYNFSRPIKDLYSTKVEEEEPKSELELLHDKYLKTQIDNYFFYPSIYQFVLTGYLDNELLKEELKKRYPEEPPIEITSFRKLLAYNFRSISNEEFETTAKEVFGYAIEGKYGIYDYLQLSRFYNYFSENKLIEISLSEIQEGLKKGLAISKQRKESNKTLFDSIFRRRDKEDDEIIFGLIKEAHEEVEKEKELLNTNKLIEAIKQNDIALITSVIAEYRVQKELFENLNARNLFDELVSCDNNTISLFTRQLENRYDFGNVKDYLISDHKILNELSDLIFDFLKGKTKLSLSEFLLKELAEKCREICLKLE